MRPPARGGLSAGHSPLLPPLLSLIAPRVQSLPVQSWGGRGRPAALLRRLEEVGGQARPRPRPRAGAGRPGAVVVVHVAGLVLVSVRLGRLVVNYVLHILYIIILYIIIYINKGLLTKVDIRGQHPCLGANLINTQVGMCIFRLVNLHKT